MSGKKSQVFETAYCSDGARFSKVGFRVLEVTLCNGLNKQVEQGFSSFFAKFLMIFQNEAY